MMAGAFNWLSQVVSVTELSLRTILERKGSSAATAVGIAGVVAVLVGVFAMAEGFRHAMTASASPDRALVLRSGADTEMTSILTGEDVTVVADFPGVARSERGPKASAELFTIINLPKRSTGTDANVPLRGVQAGAFAVREEVQVVEGRRFEPGRNEILVGWGAQRAFAGLDVGAQVQVGRMSWTVVGLFKAGGGLWESEIWTDATVLQGAYQRGNSYQSVYVKLTSAEEFRAFKDRLTTDARLKVKVERESDYYAEQSSLLYNVIMGLGTLVAGLMAVGAVFGALNTMYTAVASRTREIATLRALGFGATPVVVSVIGEALVLAIVGGAVGGGLAYAVFDGYRAATLNWQSFSQVAFAFQVTPKLLLLGLMSAALIGLAGGLLPAVRAARLPIATALRAL